MEGANTGIRRTGATVNQRNERTTTLRAETIKAAARVPGKAMLGSDGVGPNPWQLKTPNESKEAEMGSHL